MHKIFYTAGHVNEAERERGKYGTTDSWVDCSVCGKRYGSFMSSCPRCGIANSFAVEQPPAVPPGRSSGVKIALGAGVAIAVVATVVLLAPALLSSTMLQELLNRESNPAITILQPQSPEPRSVPREELVQHALDLINKDRQEFGLPPVELSQNHAAQAHAEDIFQTKQISHWMSNGEKPYMTYTKYDGEGSLHQNVAISGFEKSEYEECWNEVMYDCEEIEPLSTIEELQYQMMYGDKECCNDGHRNNILDSRHTHVSIGIVYDNYYLALVQNFENNYGLDIDVSGDQAKVSGELAAGTLEQIAIYYDEMPTPEIYEQNKRLLSYSTGELVATVARPLPPGYYYEQQDGHRLIVANRWNAQGDSVDVTFNLAEAVSRGDGVYTLFAVVKDGDQTFHTTSHSVFVDSS